MENLCEPFEDYDYNVFGHDRIIISLADLGLLSGFWALLVRQPASPTKLWLSFVGLALSTLWPLHMLKSLYTFAAPISAVHSNVLCMFLRIEYTTYYFVSTFFQQSTFAFYIFIAANRSTFFLVTHKERAVFTLIFVEAAILSISYANFSTISFVVMTFIYQQILFLGLLVPLQIVVGFMMLCSKSKPLNLGKHGKEYRMGWLQIYINAPLVSQIYQTAIISTLLWPLLSSDSTSYNYPFSLSQRSVEANLVHKFTFTTFTLLIPCIFLPPFHRQILGACCKCRQDRVSDNHSQQSAAVAS